LTFFDLDSSLHPPRTAATPHPIIWVLEKSLPESYPTSPFFPLFFPDLHSWFEFFLKGNQSPLTKPLVPLVFPSFCFLSFEIFPPDLFNLPRVFVSICSSPVNFSAPFFGSNSGIPELFFFGFLSIYPSLPLWFAFFSGGFALPFSPSTLTFSFYPFGVFFFFLCPT